MTLSDMPACALARVAAALIAISLPWGAAVAQDAKVGRQKAQACVVCHGALGIAQAPNTPNLAGQPALYVEAQLRAYRSGARKNEVMAVIAKPLTDDDIAHLAAWFASIKIEAQPPQ